MANFEEAIKIVLDHEIGSTEDGYVEDHAGATKYGITLRSLDIDIDLDGDIDADDIRALDLEKSIEFYKRRWWDRYHYGHINHDFIATKIFDLAVNMGARQAGKIAQRALRAYGVTVVDDGILGPVSIKAINQAAPAKLLVAIRSEAAGFYRGLVIKSPDYKTYINGWLNRAYA